MEKGPKIRIIGDATNRKKENVETQIHKNLTDFYGSLSEEEIEILNNHEIEKTKKETALINLADQETSRLMQESGVESYSIPPRNIHIISGDLSEKLLMNGNRIAVAIPSSQRMFLRSRSFENKPVVFGSAIFHEMLHLKAHISVEVKKDISILSRSGVSINSSIKKMKEDEFHEHFLGLNEAIIVEAEKRFIPKLIDNPELSGEKEWMSSDEAEIRRKEISEEVKIPEEDIVWINEKDTKDFYKIPYHLQRDVFSYICQEVQKQFPDKYQNFDDVYKVFLKACFTGKLMEISHLVEDTFGKGSFRILGDMDTSKSSGISCLENLKKLRMEKL